MNANPALAKMVELALTEFTILPAYAQHLIRGHAVMVSINKPKLLSSACGLFNVVASMGFGGREVINSLLCSDQNHGRHRNCY